MLKRSNHVAVIGERKLASHGRVRLENSRRVCRVPLRQTEIEQLRTRLSSA
jgi:hypothetical protein